jgi:hypothetical protein
MYLEADNISYFSRDGLHLKQGKELTTVQFIFTVTLIPFSTYPSCHYREHHEDDYLSDLCTLQCIYSLNCDQPSLSEQVPFLL